MRWRCGAAPGGAWSSVGADILIDACDRSAPHRVKTAPNELFGMKKEPSFRCEGTMPQGGLYGTATNTICSGAANILTGVMQTLNINNRLVAVDNVANSGCRITGKWHDHSNRQHLLPLDHLETILNNPDFDEWEFFYQST
jgi:hypothetical protein